MGTRKGSKTKITPDPLPRKHNLRSESKKLASMAPVTKSKHYLPPVVGEVRPIKRWEEWGAQLIIALRAEEQTDKQIGQYLPGRSKISCQVRRNMKLEAQTRHPCTQEKDALAIHARKKQYWSKRWEECNAVLHQGGTKAGVLHQGGTHQGGTKLGFLHQSGPHQSSPAPRRPCTKAALHQSGSPPKQLPNRAGFTKAVSHQGGTKAGIFYTKAALTKATLTRAVSHQSGPPKRTHQDGNFYTKAALTKAALIKRLSTLQRSPHHSGTYT